MQKKFYVYWNWFSNAKGKFWWEIYISKNMICWLDNNKNDYVVYLYMYTQMGKTMFLPYPCSVLRDQITGKMSDWLIAFKKQENCWKVNKPNETITKKKIHICISGHYTDCCVRQHSNSLYQIDLN